MFYFTKLVYLNHLHLIHSLAGTSIALSFSTHVNRPSSDSLIFIWPSMLEGIIVGQYTRSCW